MFLFHSALHVVAELWPLLSLCGVVFLLVRQARNAAIEVDYKNPSQSSLPADLCTVCECLGS